MWAKFPVEGKCQRGLDGYVLGSKGSQVILTFPGAQDIGVRVMGLGMSPQVSKWQLCPVAQTRNIAIILASLSLTPQQILWSSH